MKPFFFAFLGLFLINDYKILSLRYFFLLSFKLFFMVNLVAKGQVPYHGL